MKEDKNVQKEIENREKKFNSLIEKHAEKSQILFDLLSKHKKVRLKQPNGYWIIMKCDLVYDGYVVELENGLPSETKRFTLDEFKKSVQII